jgi:streptomycin 6-kinase
VFIPENFKDKIIGTFGDKGREWLEELPKIIEACKEKWDLVDYNISNSLSYNFVCFAKSLKFGEVALKIGVPNPELYTEIKALALYDGKNICKCYDFDTELGAFIIERIMPGEDLTALSDINKRIEVAADLIFKLNAPVVESDGFPSYTDWVNRAFKRARNENRVGSKMLDYINTAEKYFDEIEVLNHPKVLLHGDLHHFNILQEGNGSWKVIDPKGVMGVHYFECGAFMENQLHMVAEEEKLNVLKKMIETFSVKFCETKYIMSKVFFVNTVLRTCWTFEEDVKPSEDSDDVRLCELIFNYIKQLDTAFLN